MNKNLKFKLFFTNVFVLFLLLSFNKESFADTLDNTNNTSNETMTISYSEEDYISFKSNITDSFNVNHNNLLNKKIDLYNSSNTLIGTEKELKKLIYSELKNRATTIDISKFCTSLTSNDINYIFNLYFDTLYENPDIFYTSDYVSLNYYTINDYLTSCKLIISYPYDDKTLDKMINEFSSKVSEIMDLYLQDISNPLELEYEIYDYIINNTEYDFENYYNDTIPYLSHTAYGSIINGVAVCDGYSKAAKLLFNLVGIESGIVVSEEMNHAWNYVKIDDQYYHLDMTWDDPDYDTSQRFYNYFNLSDEEMSLDHTWPDLYPSCTSDKFLFLRENVTYNSSRLKNKIYFNSYENKIYSIDLNGNNLSPFIENIPIHSIIAYNNILYISYNKEIKSFNLSSKELTTFKTFSSYISDIDIINGILKVSLSSSEELEFDLKLPEDINCDGIVDILDISTLSLKYNVKSDDKLWRKRFDLNQDLIIDIFDITSLAKKL